MRSLLCALALLAAQPTEHVTDLRVQGNTLTAEADIIRMAGVESGTAVTPTLLDEVGARVKAAGHFRHVDVLKRYASIEDPTRILLVLVIDEGPVVVRPMKDGRPAFAARRRGPPLMFLPVLGSTDGYGFTYGALLSIPKVAGPRTRLSIPLTWGGERHAGAELETRFDSPRLTRLRVGGSWLRRENRALDAVDRRERVWVRGEREVVRPLRLGAWTGVDQVTFGSADSRVVRAGVDATVDTRVDPMLSRNAVYISSAIERLKVLDGPAPVRTVLDASAYLGAVGPSTLVFRVYRDGASRPVPGYLKVLLGRDSTLRGVPAGSAAGDSTAAGTVELRVPLNSPMSVGKLGVRVFLDTAAVYNAGHRLQDQHFERGAGGGVWFTATVIRLALDVAHGSTGSTRVVVSSGLTF